MSEEYTRSLIEGSAERLAPTITHKEQQLQRLNYHYVAGRESTLSPLSPAHDYPHVRVAHICLKHE